MRRGVDELERVLIRAVKGMSAAELDKYGIDWKEATKEIGRVGPEGFKKGSKDLSRLGEVIKGVVG